MASSRARRQGVASRAQAKVAAQIRAPTPAVSWPCTRIVSRRRPLSSGRAQPLSSPSNSSPWTWRRATPTRRLQARPRGRPTWRRNSRPRRWASASRSARPGRFGASGGGGDAVAVALMAGRDRPPARPPGAGVRRGGETAQLRLRGWMLRAQPARRSRPAPTGLDRS